MGDVIRGLGALTAKDCVDWLICGVAFAIAGEPSGLKVPNWIPLLPDGFPTGPPLGVYPEAPAALIVTEDFRLCSPSPGAELIPAVAPLIAGESTVGTAGMMGFRPFTGETVSCLPC